jgi:hypothetical protein
MAKQYDQMTPAELTKELSGLYLEREEIAAAMDGEGAEVHGYYMEQEARVNNQINECLKWLEMKG